MCVCVCGGVVGVVVVVAVGVVAGVVVLFEGARAPPVVSPGLWLPPVRGVQKTATGGGARTSVVLSVCVLSSLLLLFCPASVAGAVDWSGSDRHGLGGG